MAMLITRKRFGELLRGWVLRCPVSHQQLSQDTPPGVVDLQLDPALTPDVMLEEIRGLLEASTHPDLLKMQPHGGGLPRDGSGDPPDAA